MVGPPNYTLEEENENTCSPFPHVIQSCPYPTLMHNSPAVPKTFHPVFFPLCLLISLFPTPFFSFCSFLCLPYTFFFASLFLFFSFFVPFFFFSFLLPFSFLFLYLSLFISSLSPLLLSIGEALVIIVVASEYFI